MEEIYQLAKELLPCERVKRYALLLIPYYPHKKAGAIHMHLASILFHFLLCFILLAVRSESMTTKIAILGGGTVGTTLAKALVDNGKKHVVIAARNPDKTMTQLAEQKLTELKVEAVADALQEADAIVLATPSIANDAGIQELATSLGDMTGKVIIDATNPLGSFEEGLNVRWGERLSGGEVLAQALPTAKVYKSFNTLGVEHMKHALGKTMMIAGDPDDASRKIAEEVVAGVGFKPFYVGPIRYARNLEAIAGELFIENNELCFHSCFPSNFLLTAFALVVQNSGSTWPYRRSEPAQHLATFGSKLPAILKYIGISFEH